MFTRRVIIKLKSDSSAEFTRINEGEIRPRLRGQQGLWHEDAFVSPRLSEAVINSYWDREEHAEAYSRTAYPEGLEALAGVLDGAPQVETFNTSSATFHKITAGRREANRTSRLARG